MMCYPYLNETHTQLDSCSSSSKTLAALRIYESGSVDCKAGCWQNMQHKGERS